MEKIAATSPPAVYIFARLSTRIEFTTDKGLEINPFFCTAFIKEQHANISSLSSISRICCCVLQCIAVYRCDKSQA